MHADGVRISCVLKGKISGDSLDHDDDDVIIRLSVC